MSNNIKILNRNKVGELPLIYAIAYRIGLRNILDEFIPCQNNEKIAPADTMMLLISNLTIGKDPLDEIENWMKTLDLRCIGDENHKDIKVNDDRFGRVLDRLYSAERATIMTKIVVKTIKAFNISLHRIHNDYTTIKATGKCIENASKWFELKNGKSKDHRPDLNKLLFSLSLSSDGALPIHYKAYPGNCTDDTIHIEIWDTICGITQDKTFIYVADCKVCTDSQLNHIVDKGGRVITLIPEDWSEVSAFKEKFRKEFISKKEIYRKESIDNQSVNYYYSYDGDYYTNKRKYRIHWIFSSEKCKNDLIFREKRLNKCENMLDNLLLKLNKRKLKTKEAIQEAIEGILKHHKVTRFIDVTIGEISTTQTIQIGKDSPGVDTKYKTIVNQEYKISWVRNKNNLKDERNVDGIFPLLSTDTKLTAKDALIAYKYQPRLEKRFNQFKSIHNAAPLLFNKLERIEANMFLFFVALMIQALIAREIRTKMGEYQMPSLQVYPENRAVHPTTAKVFDIFSQISTYTITIDGDVVEEYRDKLNDVQLKILRLLAIDEEEYWNGHNKNYVKK